MSVSEKVCEPLITIITVVHNGEEHLEQTIESVLNHRQRNIEYIIIDGGSTDGTVGIIKKYEPNISFWQSQPDNGIYDAMNKGWAVAKENSYILYLGSGDKIISLPDDMSKYKLDDVIYGKVFIGDKLIFNSSAGFRLKIYNSLHHQALLINKSLSPAEPFDLNFNVYADFDFNQRLMKSGVNFVYSEDFKAFAMPGGISTVLDFAESLRVIEKNYGLIWSSVARAGYWGMKFLPVLKKLRPFAGVGL